MFSPSEIDNVAWFLLLLIAAWILVTALVDLSGGRSDRQSEQPTDDRLDGKGD